MGRPGEKEQVSVDTLLCSNTVQSSSDCSPRVSVL